MLVDLIVGTRPNFVKVAPLIKELDKRKKKNVFNINYRLIHTGQHYSTKLSEVFFKDLKIPKPKINFNVGSSTHSRQVAKIMIAYEKVLLKKNQIWSLYLVMLILQLLVQSPLKDLILFALM